MAIITEEAESSSRARRLSERNRRASDVALHTKPSPTTPKKTAKSRVELASELANGVGDEDEPMEDVQQTQLESEKKSRRKKKNVEIDSGVGLDESETVTGSQANDAEDAFRIPDAMDVDGGVGAAKINPKKKKRRHRKTKREPGDVKPDISGELPAAIDVAGATAQSKDRTKKKQKDLLDAANHPEEARTEAIVDSSIDSRVWEWISLADPSHQSTPPAFSKDGKYYFSITSSSVRIHSTETGHVLSTLSPPTSSRKSKAGSHTRRITSLALNPDNAFQLLTASLDGTVKIWDYVDAALLRTIDHGRPILHMAMLSGSDVIVASRRDRETQDKTVKPPSFTISRISLQPPSSLTKPHHTPTKSTVIGKLRFLTALAVSPRKDWLVAIDGDKVFTWPLSSSAPANAMRIYSSPENLTCLAFHPSENYFATGDAIGQIRLWYCLQNPSSSPAAVATSKQAQRSQTKVMHWHAHAVASLTFTPNGAYLLSGGEEAVLVIWELASGGFKKEFVPRVGSAIEWVSTNLGLQLQGQVGTLEYVLGLEDGTTVVVNAATLKVSKSFSGLKLNPQSFARTQRLPLSYHPLSNSVILPSSHPSSLQIYSPSTSRLLSELEVSPSNRISRRDDDLLEFARVELVRVDPSGRWMATIDTRSGETGRSGKPEVYLKIWEWAAEGEEWKLAARFDDPHTEGDIKEMLFRPKKKAGAAELVSSGGDGSVKVWKVVSSKTGDYWILSSTYTTRSQPLQLAFSPDGSLLAVGQTSFVTLHTPEKMEVVETIACAEFRDVAHLAFVGEKGRWLAVGSLRDVVMWDVLRGTVNWRFSSPHLIVHLVPHTKEETFAILQHPWIDDASEKPFTGAVFLKAEGGGKPYATRSLPYRLRIVDAVPSQSIAPSKSSLGFTIVGITESWKVLLCGDQPQRVVGGVVDAKAERNLATLPALKRKTLFEDIFGKGAFVGSSAAASTSTSKRAVHQETVAADAALGFFDKPSHLMPSIESVWGDAISAFLKPRAVVAVKKAVERREEGDAMQVDEEEGALEVSQKEYRRVTDEEVVDMIGLFRGMSVPSQHPSTPSKPRPKPVSRPTSTLIGVVVPSRPTLTNGISKPSSVRSGSFAVSKPSSVINGTGTPKPPSTILAPDSEAEAEETESETEGASGAKVGEKRKA